MLRPKRSCSCATLLADLLTKRILFVPKNTLRTVAAAPLKVLWPEMYSGKGGVTSSGVQAGSGFVAEFPSRAAAWIAVIGRQKL